MAETMNSTSFCNVSTVYTVLYLRVYHVTTMPTVNISLRKLNATLSVCIPFLM